MRLNESERRFVARRRILAGWWPAVGGALLVALVALWVWTAVRMPLLGNPFEAFRRVGRGDVCPRTVQMLAAMASVLFVVGGVLAAACVLSVFAVTALERRYHAILDRLDSPEGGSAAAGSVAVSGTAEAVLPAGERGLRLGWTLGLGVGGFLWVPVLACVLFFQGRVLAGIAAVCISAVAAGCIAVLAPWHHPMVRLRVLMVPCIVLFVVAWIVVAWGFGGTWAELRYLLMCSPVLIPLFTVGGRTWLDLRSSARRDTGP